MQCLYFTLPFVIHNVITLHYVCMLSFAFLTSGLYVIKRFKIGERN